MKGKGKKQACKKKTDVGVKESKQKDQKLPDKKDLTTDLQVL